MWKGGGGQRAQEDQAGPRQARTHSRKQGHQARRQHRSRLTDAFQEGQSSLSEPGRDELASPPWPRVSCRTVSYSQISVITNCCCDMASSSTSSGGPRRGRGSACTWVWQAPNKRDLIFTNAASSGAFTYQPKSKMILKMVN